VVNNGDDIIKSMIVSFGQLVLIIPVKVVENVEPTLIPSNHTSQQGFFIFLVKSITETSKISTRKSTDTWPAHTCIYRLL